MQTEALQLLQEASRADPRSSQRAFNAALACLDARDFSTAEHYAMRAIELNCIRPEFACVLALVRTGQQRHGDACAICTAGLRTDPDCAPLMLLLARIVFHSVGAEQALTLYHAMALEFAPWHTWQKGSGGNSSSTDAHFTGLKGGLRPEGSVTGGSVSSHDNAGSVLSSNIGAQQPLSRLPFDIAGGGGSRSTRSLFQTDVWLQMAKCFHALGMPADAQRCVWEARLGDATSAEVECCAGQGALQTSAGDGIAGFGVATAATEAAVSATAATTAANYFDCALALDPLHVPSLVGLAALHLEQGHHATAEPLLLDALSVDPYLPEAWQLFSDMLSARGHDSAGVGCLLTALDLQATMPIQSAASLQIQVTL
jgi:tetratricopeptide (TPR) repeat protein